jgi:hypothetical protein
MRYSHQAAKLFPFTCVATRHLTIWVLCTLLAAPVVSLADSWITRLDEGQTVSVDPTTNRAIIRSGDAAGQPLWDGVHRLQDGSTITIRSGVMVPNEELARSHAAPQPLRPGDEAARLPAQQRNPACDLLVIKTCGLQGECSDFEACHLARQLRKLQNNARQDRQGQDWAIAQCQQADRDPGHFPACSRARSRAISPCQQLVEMLCVDRKRCAGSDACSTALQLQQLEWQTYYGESPEASQGPSRQCRQMLVEHAFFAPCR